MRPDLEALAEAVHEAYLTTCKRLGWPIKPSNAVPYAELSEDSKELDRASVRAVLACLEPKHAVDLYGSGHLSSGSPLEAAGSAQDADQERAVNAATLKTAAYFWGGTDGEFREWVYERAHAALVGNEDDMPKPLATLEENAKRGANGSPALAQGPDMEERLARLMTPWFGFIPKEWQRCKGNAAEVLAILQPSPAPAAPAPEVITEDGMKSAQVVWHGDPREIGEIAIIDNRIIGRAESNLPWTTFGTLPAVETVGPGLAKIVATGKVVAYCTCEEKSGDSSECPIHPQSTKDADRIAGGLDLEGAKRFVAEKNWVPKSYFLSLVSEVEKLRSALLPSVGGVTGSPDPGPQPLEVPDVNLVPWEISEKVITVGGKVVGCTLTEKDGRSIRDWLQSAIREIWEMRALDHEDFPAPQLRARLIQRINENNLLLEQLEAVHQIWLAWRENGMANAITKAGEYLHKIGKVVDPSYPTDRLRAPEPSGTPSETPGGQP